jgi:capsule polysaccharide export protein KpsE/RkpR
LGSCLSVNKKTKKKVFFSSLFYIFWLMPNKIIGALLYVSKILMISNLYISICILTLRTKQTNTLRMELINLLHTKKL